MTRAGAPDTEGVASGLSQLTEVIMKRCSLLFLVAAALGVLLGSLNGTRAVGQAVPPSIGEVVYGPVEVVTDASERGEDRG